MTKDTPQETVANQAAAEADGARLTLEFLDPHSILFTRASSGNLMLEIKDKVVYLDVRIRRAFPVSDPDHFIEVRTRDGTYIGMIESFSALSEHNRGMVAEEIERSYLVPVITAVHEADDKHGSLFLDVATTRGPAKIYVFHPHDDIVHLRDGRLRIKDALGNAYEIRPRLLDSQSLARVERYI